MNENGKLCDYLIRPVMVYPEDGPKDEQGRTFSRVESTIEFEVLADHGLKSGMSMVKGVRRVQNADNDTVYHVKTDERYEFDKVKENVVKFLEHRSKDDEPPF